MTDHDGVPPADATDDAEDAAIARALHVPEGESGGADVALVADYDEVLAALAPDRSPPPDLEERIVAAALSVRPASTTTIATARARRAARHTGAAHRAHPPAARAATTHRRLLVVAAAAVLAAVVGVASAIAVRTDGGRDVGLVSDAGAADGAAVAAALERPGAQRFVLRTPAGALGGRAVLAPSGDRYDGFLYDLELPVAPAGSTYWLWITTPEGAVPVGDLGVQPGVVAFDVRGAFDAPLVTREATGDEPSTPGETVLEAERATSG